MELTTQLHWFVAGLLAGTIGNFIFNTVIILLGKDE